MHCLAAGNGSFSSHSAPSSLTGKGRLLNKKKILISISKLENVRWRGIKLLVQNIFQRKSSAANNGVFGIVTPFPICVEILDAFFKLSVQDISGLIRIRCPGLVPSQGGSEQICIPLKLVSDSGMLSWKPHNLRRDSSPPDAALGLGQDKGPGLLNETVSAQISSFLCGN